LVPVLPLRFQTYRHYLYPALPGLALAFSAVAVSVAQFLSQFVGWSPGRKQVVTAVLLGICLLAYAARSESLIVARISARVTGTDLPLDPVMRRRVVAQRAIGSLAGRLGPEHARLAILSPSGLAAVYDVRTGRRAAPSDPGSQPYDLLQESLDHGGALKLFFPQIDSVAFISQWSPEHRGDVLFLSYPGGYLVGGGTGPAALESITMWMFQAGWYPQAKEYLRSVVTAYPDEAPLRLAYAGALFKLGEKEAARQQLQQILRSTPAADSAAVQARAILEAMPS
jgi:tetratricopeptide (TPR) repeat protein